MKSCEHLFDFYLVVWACVQWALLSCDRLSGEHMSVNHTKQLVCSNSLNNLRRDITQVQYSVSRTTKYCFFCFGSNFFIPFWAAQVSKSAKYVKMWVSSWGRPVRTKSRQNESLFRSNGTHVFVLLGFRSDGISFQRDRALQRVAYCL